MISIAFPFHKLVTTCFLHFHSIREILRIFNDCNRAVTSGRKINEVHPRSRRPVFYVNQTRDGDEGRFIHRYQFAFCRNCFLAHAPHAAQNSFSENFSNPHNEKIVKRKVFASMNDNDHTWSRKTWCRGVINGEVFFLTLRVSEVKKIWNLMERTWLIAKSFNCAMFYFSLP